MKTLTMTLFALVVVAITACSSDCCRGDRGQSTYTYSAPVASAPADMAVAVPSAPSGGKEFPTREAAMAAVAAACGQHDQAQVEGLFGPGATEVLMSGDDVADREGAMRVKTMIETAVAFDERSDTETVAEIGKEAWPFPIPLVKTAGGWRFDIEKGKDELLSRRIGRNELEVIATLYEFVKAQKEYFAKGRDGNPAAYAQKVRSSEGKHDGLFWKSAEGEEESPFGELAADAQKAGYGPADGQPRPFHGYYFKILTGQGKGAPGGAKSYLDSKGLMTGGFAAIAWPATYGNSGIMTFLVSGTGVVFEKDQGRDTERLASAVTGYDPDRTWHPSARSPEIDEDN